MVIRLKALRAAAVFALLLSMSLPSIADGSLMGHSVKVTTINGAQSRHFGRPYAWTSNDQVVISGYDGRRGDWDNFLVLRTLSTGRERPLTKLTNLFVGDGAGLTEYLEATSDGKWLLWFNGAEDSAVGGVYGGEIRGNHISKHQFSGYMSVMPIPGDHAWMAFLLSKSNSDDVDRFSIFNLNNGHVATLRFPTPVRGMIPDCGLTRVNSELYLYIIPTVAKFADPEYVLKYHVGQKVTLVSKTRLAPRPADSDGIYFSPDCKHIAWAIQKGSAALRIVVTDVDGTHPRDLGPIDNPVESALGSWTTTLAWLPDGHHISYVYNNALYVVPTD